MTARRANWRLFGPLKRFFPRFHVVICISMVKTAFDNWKIVVRVALFPRKKFIISSRAKRARITWTARGLRQKQNSRQLGNIDFAADVKGTFSCIIHARLRCVYSSSIKQCLRSVNHEQFPMQMTQNNKHNKWLEMLASRDFPPKLLRRTPTKIHREGRRRRQQEAVKQRDNGLAQRRQRHQHSDHKHE